MTDPQAQAPDANPQPASADRVASPRPRIAWYSPAPHIIFWTLVIGGVALDLLSKEWAFHTLRQDQRQIVVPYVLEFQTMFNSGALFGIGAGQTAIFLGASIIALLLVFTMFARSSPRQFVLHIALGAICAGALGNMYDRAFVRLVDYRSSDGSYALRRYVKSHDAATGDIVLTEYPPAAGATELRLRAGHEIDSRPEIAYVRDFIKINSTIGGREIWPWVFNIADMLLVGGVAILSLKLLLERRPHPSASTAAQPS